MRARRGRRDRRRRRYERPRCDRWRLRRDRGRRVACGTRRTRRCGRDGRDGCGGGQWVGPDHGGGGRGVCGVRGRSALAVVTDAVRLAVGVLLAPEARVAGGLRARDLGEQRGDGQEREQARELVHGQYPGSFGVDLFVLCGRGRTGAVAVLTGAGAHTGHGGHVGAELGALTGAAEDVRVTGCGAPHLPLSQVRSPLQSVSFWQPSTTDEGSAGWAQPTSPANRTSTQRKTIDRA